jgi:hypothetical protein
MPGGHGVTGRGEVGTDAAVVVGGFRVLGLVDAREFVLGRGAQADGLLDEPGDRRATREQRGAWGCRALM